MLFVVAVSGCARSAQPAEEPAAPGMPGPPVAPAGPAPAPAASAGQAVAALLDAERRLDHDASFRLLTAAGRAAYGDPADWARRRRELPPITAFSVDGERDGLVTATVRHEPGLDPFVGLSPARERQTWTARREGGGWLVDPDPAVDVVLPGEAAAVETARAWSASVQGCDAAGARRLQALDPLLGVTDAPAGLCRTGAAADVGPAGTVPAGPASQELVAQFGTEIFQWARAVRVTAPGVRPFQVVLAPIGDTWQLVGLFEG